MVRFAYCSPEHNRAVDGATRSNHLDGAAFNIAMANYDPVAFEAAAREVGLLGFGSYTRSGFIHVDLGPARQWGERFPVRATVFAAEMLPAREVLAESRTMKASGAADVATLGAAGVEVAQNVLAETQSAILPLVPYLDTLRWVFIAVALAGVAVTIYARIDDWKRGAAMIGSLLAGIATNPFAQTVLRYGAIALTVFLFLLALRRFGERAGRLHIKKPVHGGWAMAGPTITATYRRERSCCSGHFES
ncbi:YcbK family protein [Borborobacter arsenicus]|uniref:YcbK family protein n=1 Tax=Borborobacter arsenicus TaxID=1851146 RepID=UPI001FDF7ED2|nr:D-Ala-D-Ala carboxypeptidase family metallohydrolase [Pseudaminobacter arsenicus]